MSHLLSFHPNQILSLASVVCPTISLLASWESNTVCYAIHRVQQQRTSQCLCGSFSVSPEILVLNTKSHLKKYVVDGFGLIFVRRHSSFLTCHHHQSLVVLVSKVTLTFALPYVIFQSSYSVGILGQGRAKLPAQSKHHPMADD